MTWQFPAAASLIWARLTLTWLIQSTVLLAAGLIAGRLLRKWGPAVQSALYRTVLVAVILCPIASVSMAALGFSGLLIRLPAPSEDEEAALAREPVGEATRSSVKADAARSEPHDSSLAQTRESVVSPMMPQVSHDGANEAGDIPPLVPTVPLTEPSPSLFHWAAVIGRASNVIMAAWLLGGFGLGVRLWIDHRRMARLRCSAIDAEPAVVVLCRDLAQPMGVAPPPVLRSPFLCSPCLDGVRRPAILLPEDAADNLRETFIHELAHLRRRDGLWNLVRHGATAVLWLQPLLWILSKRLEETAEEVCDDSVVEFGADRSRYASHLLELAERRLAPLAPSSVGMISLRSLLARRIMRILDSTRTLSTQAGRRAIVATLLAGLAGTLLVGMLGIGGGNREVFGDAPKVAAKSAAEPATESAVERSSDVAIKRTVHGRVVGPDGQPIAGATVAVGRYRRGGIGYYNHFSEREELDRWTTDREGRFRLTFEDSEPSSTEDEELSHPWSNPAIAAWAPGFGPAWPQTLAKDVTEDKPLQLVRDDVPITARIVDLEGRPVKDATIQVQMVESPESTQAVDRWVEDASKPPDNGKRPQAHWFPSRSRLPGIEPAVSNPATTDGDGRFRLTGLGRDRLAILDIRGQSIAFRRVNLITRRINRLENPPDGPTLFDRGFYGADGTIVVEPGQPIKGAVRDADTKAPIAGAIVTAAQLAGSLRDIEGLISTKTDADGRYCLVGLPKASGHKLSVYPPLDRPYFITGFLKVPAVPGLETIAFDVNLKRGIWITGRVTDAQTGQPVHAAIHYYPFLSNTLARAYPNFQANSTSLYWTGNRFRTGAAGRFRVVGLPGRGIVAAKTFDRSYRLGFGADSIPEWARQRGRGDEPLPTYNHIHASQFQAIAAIDPPAGSEEFGRDLPVQASPSLTVQLVDPRGKPITNAMAWGRFPDSVGPIDVDLYEQSRAQIVGLDPKGPRMVVFQHEQRKLGAVLFVSSEEAAREPARTVTLRPCATVTGRIVDAEGKPASGGVHIRVASGKGERALETEVFPVPLDADGRFRIDTVVPGATYSLRAEDRLALGLSASGRMEPERFKPFELARNLIAQSGQVIELGTFNATTGQRVKDPDKITAPKSEQGHASARIMPITGRIIDLEGRPVAGATVQVTQITKPNGDSLDPWIEAVKRGEPTWIAYKQLIYAPPIQPEEKRQIATTDTQGRFRIDGLEAERVVDIVIHGPAISYTSLDVITRLTDPILAKGFPTDYGSEARTIFGADFTYTAAPGRPVEGVVRDAATRQPLAGVQLVSEHFAGAVMHGIRDLKTTTDGQGRFRLVGLPKGSGNAITALPNDDQSYFVQRVPVPDPAGMAPVQLEIALHKGIWIEGKVTDQGTGEPVAGAWLYYLPFRENTFAQATPEFDRNGNGPNTTHQDRYQTKSDGTYRLVGLAGRAIVGVQSHSKKPYLMGDGSASIKGMNKHGDFETWRNPVNAGKLWPTSMKEINPTATTTVVHLDFDLKSGAKVRMRVVDSRGKPVAGLKLAGRSQRGRHESDVKPESEFDVVTLAEGEDRMVLIRNEERKLGKVVHVKPGDDEEGPVTVTLEPLATIVGRVADADGNPVSGATILTDPLPGGDFSLDLEQVASGSEGRFVVPDVPVGCEYTLVAESRLGPKDRPVAFSQNKKVRPGETTDVGEIRFKSN